MATAQEILNAMEEVEEQNVIVIDSDLRTIRIPDGIKILGVESDDDVLRLHFKMPKMYGEFDLSTFALRVNYLNANGDGDVFEVQDAAANGDELKFSWLVGRTAAQYKGDVKFIVCAKKVKEGGIVEKEFNTTPATLPVLEGLETIERVVQENPDVIEAILLRLDKLEKNGGGAGIDDTTPSTTTTYSSSKIDALLNEQKEAIDAQDEAIGKKLNVSELPTAINTALTEAKNSGEFKGDTGAPGAKGDPGDDYVLTEADKEEIAEMAAGMVEVPEGGGGYTLPVASPSQLGGVRPTAKTDGMTQEIGVDKEGKLWGPLGGGGGKEWKTVFETTTQEEVSSVDSPAFNSGSESLAAIQAAEELVMSCIMPKSETQESYGKFGFGINNSGGVNVCTIVDYWSTTNTTPTTESDSYVYAHIIKAGSNHKWWRLLNRKVSGVDKVDSLVAISLNANAIGTRFYFRLWTDKTFPVGSAIKIEVR